MADFSPGNLDLNTSIISTTSPEALGNELAADGRITGFSAAAWPTANLAYFIPFLVYQTATAYRMFTHNGAVSGNGDVGIYTDNGARIVSKGSTALAGSTAIQSWDITDTVLYPGMYYMAIAVDNTTHTHFRCGPNVTVAKMMGMAQMASAFALPSTATFATVGSGYIPSIGVALRDLV